MADLKYNRIFADSPVLVAYLFGSRAEGRARPSSRRHILYNADDEARVAFEVRTMQEWFDWEPRYRRMQQARLKHFAAGGD